MYKEPKLTTQMIQYKSFLLRLWFAKQDGELRATLTNVQCADERHHFATIDALCLFLNNSVADLSEAIGETKVETGSHRTMQSPFADRQQVAPQIDLTNEQE